MHFAWMWGQTEIAAEEAEETVIICTSAHDEDVECACNKENEGHLQEYAFLMTSIKFSHKIKKYLKVFKANCALLAHKCTNN